jgi:dienelactone hydrolase
MIVRRCAILLLSLFSIPFANGQDRAGPPLSGTLPLTMEGDLAFYLVDGVDRFLLKELDKSVERRAAFWKRDFASAEAYERSLEPNRRRLAQILGVRDPRVPFDAPELVGTTRQPALVATGDDYEVHVVRWPVIRDMHGEGLLLVPVGKAPKGDVIYLPDADQTPEFVCGLAESAPQSSAPLALVAAGYRVVVPALVSRRMVQRNRRSTISQREFVYRAAFELGRHIQGYEIQKALALVDWFQREAGAQANRSIAIQGYGEGGLLALQAAALDTRIKEVELHGCFGNRQSVWQQPIDRNVFGLLEQFGDAELAAMIAPRRLVIFDDPGPTVELSGASGGAPAKLSGPAPAEVAAEVERARQLTAGLPRDWIQLVSAPIMPETAVVKPRLNSESPLPNAEERESRLVHEMDVLNQWLLQESPFVRAEFMKKLDTSSLDAYRQSVEHYRFIFRNEVIGSFDYPLLPFQARTRQVYDQEKWTGYEVVLDVWEDVIAYGILLLPKGMKPGERRPVVVCQHGLEGRPTDVIEKNHPAYHDFAARLCERGFITFAPQNLYIFRDRFRTLQRKANPLKKTLFSVIVPQHQQIVNWLKTLPHVDPERIAFYGLSYGGKSAMRIPPLVPDYCLSICSADFNEWVAKNASTRLPFSYVWTGEYEIFEFDLGSTFNYAEMAALICPRPFMVERGHMDGVSTDEWVAFEYAKVFYLYSHRLKIPDRCELEVFDGPHTIHGQGTFAFLHRHLNRPPP